jgi:sugar phosphate isomerase/epimerase
MKFGYNTNGWRGRTFLETCEALSRHGYDAVELAPQQDEYAPKSWTPMEAHRLKQIAGDVGIEISNVHAGAKHLMSRMPHEPSLISDMATDRVQRIEINKRAIDFAAELGTNLVCITSGMAPVRGSEHDSWQRLTDGVLACLDHARSCGVRIAIEPEPELFVSTSFDFLQLQQLTKTPENLGLNLDIGHAYVRYEGVHPGGGA